MLLQKWNANQWLFDWSRIKKLYFNVEMKIVEYRVTSRNLAYLRIATFKNYLLHFKTFANTCRAFTTFLDRFQKTRNIFRHFRRFTTLLYDRQYFQTICNILKRLVTFFHFLTVSDYLQLLFQTIYNICADDL